MSDLPKDDREDKQTVYGLQQDKVRFNKSMIWIPVVIGVSVAAGVLTTRAIQRIARGTGATAQTATKTTDKMASLVMLAMVFGQIKDVSAEKPAVAVLASPAAAE